MSFPFGFGGYRITDGDTMHEAALRHALERGVQLVDTSANYGDGASERLVGRFDLPAVVTKAGYSRSGTFPETSAIADGTWHCIHPDFLEDQLAHSLERLQRTSIDALLLHNPEYFLARAHHDDMSVTDARDEFARRLRTSFAWLEEQVQAGRIDSYGISSNTFPGEADDPDFVSLDTCLACATDVAGDRHHFRWIQLPMNLVEHHAATTLNHRDGTYSVLDVARDAGIRVLINRPLNAIIGNDLIRLVTHRTPLHQPDPGIVEQRIHELERTEHEAMQVVLANTKLSPQQMTDVQEVFRCASALCSSWKSFQSLPHWNDVRSQYLDPRRDAALYMADHSTDGALVRTYAEGLSNVLDDISILYASQENDSLEDLRSSLADEFGLPLDTRLQHIALHAVRCTVGVDTVLVGMRRPDYVDDVFTTLNLPAVAIHRTTWLRVAAQLQRLSA